MYYVCVMQRQLTSLVQWIDSCPELHQEAATAGAELSIVGIESSEGKWKTEFLFGIKCKRVSQQANGNTMTQKTLRQKAATAAAAAVAIACANYPDCVYRCDGRNMIIFNVFAVSLFFRSFLFHFQITERPFPPPPILAWHVISF